MILLPFKWELPQNPQNHFAAIRKYDIHTGVDIFAPEGTDVLAAEEGIVVLSGYFTGPNALYVSPWWNETSFVMVQTSSGLVHNYGEISPSVKIGDVVKRGDKIGTIQTVLKTDKGLPMSMLHFEMYKDIPDCWALWSLDENKPELLLDPTEVLKSWKKENDKFFGEIK